MLASKFLKSLLFGTNSSRKITTGILRMSGALKDDFLAAKENVTKLHDDPGNDVKLKLYALFKQATEGVVTSKRPGMMDFVGRAKWDAWSALGAITNDEAMQQYIGVVNGLLKEQGVTAGGPAKPVEDPSTFILRKPEGKVFHIKLNRPKKFNAITREMYQSVAEGLKESADNKDTTVTVLSADGDYFCSGNDLSNFKISGDTDIPTMAKTAKILCRDYVAAYIDHPKPLIGLINGPAVGISVTVLGLFDMVIASDKATFHAPFTALGQSPEGCSSFMFPRIMGISKASEFLLFGRKLTAQEAYERGLVTAVIPHDEFVSKSQKMISEYSELPPQSLSLSKGLVRSSFNKKLHETNVVECDLLEERWQSEECMVAIMNFLSRKAKL